MNHRTSPATSQSNIVFIGGGNMGRSLIGGLVTRGIDPSRIAAVAPTTATREGLANDFGIRTFAIAADALVDAGVVVLAVKPQIMREVCENLAADWPTDAVAVSVAAGITAGQLDAWLGGERAVVRAMPNTPSLLGAGATGMYANAHVSPDQRLLASMTLDAVGISVWLDDEGHMDVVTALSGSGPAYFFLFAEAMQAAAMDFGLPEAAARALAAQTCLGAGRMLVESGDDAAELRKRVTSPGGTTQAALDSLIGDGLEAIVARAIAAARDRGAELSEKAGR